MCAFLKAMGQHVGSTICELQVGMGPCGELRYPSYMMWGVSGHKTSETQSFNQDLSLKKNGSFGCEKKTDTFSFVTTCQVQRLELAWSGTHHVHGSQTSQPTVAFNAPIPLGSGYDSGMLKMLKESLLNPVELVALGLFKHLEKMKII